MRWPDILELGGLWRSYKPRKEEEQHLKNDDTKG